MVTATMIMRLTMTVTEFQMELTLIIQDQNFKKENLLT